MHFYREAALYPVREMMRSTVDVSVPRPITETDVLQALAQIKPSVSEEDLELYRNWDK